MDTSGKLQYTLEQAAMDVLNVPLLKKEILLQKIELRNEAHYKSYSSHKKVWWLGKCGHEWQAIIASRTNGTGCPCCAGAVPMVY